jgi:hypothetical protein
MAKHPLINKQNVRRFILDYAARNRAHKYTRVPLAGWTEPGQEHLC